MHLNDFIVPFPQTAHGESRSLKVVNESRWMTTSQKTNVSSGARRLILSINKRSYEMADAGADRLSLTGVLTSSDGSVVVAFRRLPIHCTAKKRTGFENREKVEPSSVLL